MQGPDHLISRGNIKIVCAANSINLFWNGVSITQDTGLNVAVNTLGLWTDSSKAHSQIIEKKEDYLKIKFVFRDLPLSQTWSLKIRDESRIDWQIDVEIEEALYIDEFRIVSVITPKYKSWLVDYRHAYFPRLENVWRDIYLGDLVSTLVGAAIPTEEGFLPSYVMESRQKDLLPLIQNSPAHLKSHLVGFRRISPRDRGYEPGRYKVFSGSINLYQANSILDEKIENLRQGYLRGVKRDKKSPRDKLKVLLVNLPWQAADGSTGVRSGSRWPHIKDRSEGNYMPFPFFLSYAASLLRENGIEAEIIDALAEEIPEDKFLEDLAGRDFDILVVETSVPSFYHDMRLLRYLSNLDFSIALCGPQYEIYKEDFLRRNEFIDFVLFGEYEFTLLELIKNLQRGERDLSSVEGLIWRDAKGGIVKNSPRVPPDINLLPWPYRDTLPMHNYWDLPGDIPHPSAQMVASRGCPFSCSFCLWPQVLFGGRTYRTREINDVVDEMEHLVKKKGFKSVYFDDDTFNIGKARIMRLSDEIIKRGLHDTPWAIMAKADLMDEELLLKMHKAGLRAVKYGVENVSQELVDRCDKRLDLKKTEEIIGFTKSLGIKTHLTFAFGLPGETKDTINKTIDYALELDPASIQFSIITPFPGTKLFDDLVRSGRILTEDWSLYDGHYRCVFQPEDISPLELVEAKHFAYRRWADFKRRKRGLYGDMKRFLIYMRDRGPKETFKKTASYFNYLLLHKGRFIGKL
ncbi:MAG: radical SAM protein [Candidatus Omnitrophica bacterium]|nr:radical SAM protein [Candidatus Omnitrophota bacterium]